MATDGVPEDNLVNDIRDIIKATRVNGAIGVHHEPDLIEKLIVYIVDRDTKVMVKGANITLNTLNATGKDRSDQKVPE